MPLHVNVSGTWQNVLHPQVNVAGVWQVVQEAWVNVAGVWQKFFANVNAAITARYISQALTSPATASAGYRLNTSGIVEAKQGSVYTTLETWLLGGVSSQFDCMATPTVGTLNTGTTATWLNLASSREWTVLKANGTKDCIFTVQIRRASDLVVVASASIELYAESL